MHVTTHPPTPADRPTRVAALAATLVVATLGVACVPGGHGADPTAAVMAGPVALTASLYQTRMGVADRQIQVKMRNLGDSDVLIQHMSLDSTGYSGTMTYHRTGSRLRAGTAVDMPVLLTEPVCDGPVEGHTVRVDYRDEDGRSGSVQVPATDDDGAVAGVHVRECFEMEVSRAVTIGIVGLPTVERRGRDVLAADLSVVVTGTGQGGHEVRVIEAGSTTLLQPADTATGRPLPGGLPIDLQAPASGTHSFDITVVPGRCDAHAIAEDKQGTRFPLRVDLDGQEGVVALVSSDQVRVALYDFVREACQD